jgi:hypothetical protein
VIVNMHGSTTIKNILQWCLGKLRGKTLQKIVHVFKDAP